MSTSKLKESLLRTYLPRKRYNTLFYPRAFLCKAKRPCKRTACEMCAQTRGSAFINSLCLAFKEKQKYSLVTASWIDAKKESPWSVLYRHIGLISKELTRNRICPRLVVLAIGEKNNTPHIHLIVPTIHLNVLRDILKKKTLEKPTVHQTPIEKHKGGIYGLAKYLWLNNALPSLRDPDRPYRLHAIRASKGIRYGFPNASNKAYTSHNLNEVFGSKS